MAKTRKSVRTGVSGNRELLTWALHGLEQEIATTKRRLQELEAQARQLRGSTRGATTAGDGAPAAVRTVKTARKRRKLSADARRRIAEAQKRRWAKARAAKE
jgi:hypothetical protein